MKSRIIFFMGLLLLWICLCSWFYVCKVRSNCSAVSKQEAEPVAVAVKPELTEVVKPSVEISPPAPHVIYFNTGSNQVSLSVDDKDFLADLDNFLSQNSGYRVQITGYADNTGSESLNLEISSLRAKHIAEKLMEAGIANDLVSSEGKGEADPIGDNSTPEGRSQNRRVIIITHKN